jgi:hypothetical protein
MSTGARWWGVIGLGEGDVARWRAGPSTAWAERCAAEWRIWHDPHGPSAAEAPARVDAAPERAPTLRFAFAEPPDTLDLTPALPDRAVVVRPTSPLALPPWQQATLVVATPAFMALRVEVRGVRRRATEVRPVLLTDLPTERLGDTWLGPSTREGELAYVLRTTAALQAEDAPTEAHRVVTPLTIDNRSDLPLRIERVALPMASLALYADPRGRLFSDGVTFTREGDGEGAASIGSGAAPDRTLLARAREASGLGAAIGKTFARLLRAGAA